MENQENQMQGQIDGGTATPNAQVDGANGNENPNQQVGGNGQEPKPQEEATSFTQEQVNDFVKERLERVYKRYNVADRKGLDDLVGKAQSYDAMKDMYSSVQEQNAKLTEELTFIKNGIDTNRYDDVRAHFKGKGLEFNNDNLVSEIATHQEWLKQVEQPTPTTTIQTMGVEHSNAPLKETSEEKMKRVFKL